jgi:hypothetical protein
MKARPNHSVNGTACKLRLQVPSAIRASAAGYDGGFNRWVQHRSGTGLISLEAALTIRCDAVNDYFGSEAGFGHSARRR